MRERIRNNGWADEYLGHSTYGDPSYTTNTYVHPNRPSLYQKCVDEIHPKHPYEGGPLQIVKRTYSYHDQELDWVGTKIPGYYSSGRSNNNYYTGKFRASPSIGSVPSSTAAVEAAEAMGPTAWNRFKPGKPVVSGAQFIFELREISQMMFKKLNSFRSLGNNYLAYQFGWKPFLKDLNSWWESMLKIDKLASQLIRDNGKTIKRGGTLSLDEETPSPKVTTSTRSIPPSDVAVPSGWHTAQYNAKRRYWKQILTETSSTKLWFSAAFRYYIPKLSCKNVGKMRAIKHLWDLEIGPEQVYQLIPYSWLVDWFSNTGDVISNFASATEDNLTAKYAYIMRHEDRLIRNSLTANLLKQSEGAYNLPPVKADIVAHAYTDSHFESKVRVAAKPYGFNVFWPDLSGYQISILSALGVSRLRY